MPGLHLHRMLAQRMLDHWDGEGINELNHYRPHCSDSRNAFFAGAFGPDLGYFPGGHRLISDLAHRVRSGQLVRHLLTTAATPIERCFAAGWLTHVVGDLLIHPAIARGVGELVNGDRTRPLGGGSHPAEHVRVETGLDAWWAAEEPGPVSCRVTFDPTTVTFLRRAIKDVYGIDVSAEHFLSSQRAATRGSLVGMQLVGWLGRNGRTPLQRPLSSAAARALEGVRQLLETVGIRPLFLSLLTPENPASWLLTHTERCLALSPRLIDHHLGTGGRELGNFNLDTGAAECASQSPPAVRGVPKRLGWGA